MKAWSWWSRLDTTESSSVSEGNKLLSHRRGPLEPPVRAEILGLSGFVQQGHLLAKSHGDVSTSLKAVAFFPRLRENIAVLHEAHRYIALQERRGRHISPAGEWLLDNVHLVVAQTREVHDGLPRRYFRSLPVLCGEGLSGLPRIYAIAWAYVAHADSAFEPTLLVDFLRAYQESQPLTQGELWALPTTLRVVLIENLRRLAERVATEEAAREAAHRLCDELDLPDAAPPQLLFDELATRGATRAFALQVMHRLHADSDTGTDHSAAKREAVRTALVAALPEPAAAQAQQQTDQAADNLSVGNAIRSLQLLGSADWRGLIAQASALVQRMLTLPGFAAERDDTQDTTLHGIERLARFSGLSEAMVADLLINLVHDKVPPMTSPGYWISGDGLHVLRAAAGLPPKRWWNGAAWPSSAALTLMVAALGAGTLALTLFFMRHAAAPELTWGGWALGAFLAIWPASEAVIAALNRVVSESVPPRRLPRLALEQGIEASQKILVVIPSLLTGAAAIQALAASLERHCLANREAHAQFALLTDFEDADAQVAAQDDALVNSALEAVASLNRRHAGLPGGECRFVLLHRARTWSDSEQCWMGWERKRGKLEQLVTLLAGGFGPEAPSPFLDFGVSSVVAAATPYVLTLDSDTVLPPGALRELVGIAAHPLTQPNVALQPPRVVSGHGILQPRIVNAWPKADQHTWFHRLFSGASGSDPYNACASEVYQDLFDEGNFTGKGLLHVSALHQVLSGRLPDGQVLSHDLLEGCMTRCGSVSDVALIEPAPTHADVAASRTHRWTRGDWQLLPLLMSSSHYSLRAIDRWKLLDNLRRSMVVPASFLLLVLTLAGGDMHLHLSPWGTLVLALTAFGAGPLVGAIAGMAPSRDDLALRHFFREALSELTLALAGLVWNVALWLRQSVLLADAIVRASWRSVVSRRRLLQWTTAAAAESSAAHGWWSLCRRHANIIFLASALAYALMASGSNDPALALTLCALWAGTPLWIAWASRARRQSKGLMVTRGDRAYLLSVAHDTWDWFAMHVNAQSHHLPPDNVQTVPHTMVAERTSPTNIGLYLLSAACAQSFGWISAAELASRVGATLDTLDRLDRERGHFLNWTDTQTLQTLLPAYVSTVDSGNLCGHLLAVASACELVHADDALTTAALQHMASRCRVLAMAAEFGFLYDARRRLMHIGWRVVEQQLDAGHYDLLASESRLASLWGIAKGDLPAAHWAALGRPFQANHAEVGLRSWSGSMFEYLMPTLVLDEPQGSALASAGEMAVAEQQAYGRFQNLPWGISESAYATVDRSMAYQYGPQGVPRLALRRTPADECVVAPYASALAAMLHPHAATLNLRVLEALGTRSGWGFLEALDCTPERQTDGSRHVKVCTYMAHHQGMVLVALANVLLDRQPRRWTLQDPHMAAVASLLQERVPREVARLQDPASSVLRATAPVGTGVLVREVLPGVRAVQRTDLLTNGRYSVALRANGAGWSRFGNVDITRHRDDALRDAYGNFFYVRRSDHSAPSIADLMTGKPTAKPLIASLSQHPAPDPNAQYSADFHSDRVCLNATWPDLRTRCTVWVSPEDDIELRRVDLWNTSSRPLDLELLSSWEVCLSEARADEMHPAFANLFISADWDAHDLALYFARKPRRPDEAEVHAVHFVAQSDVAVTQVQALADRSQWLGRLNGPARPLAQFAGPVGKGDDANGAGIGMPCATGLDPVAALSIQLHLPAHGMATLIIGTAASSERAALGALVDRYRQASVVERSSHLSATLATLRQREVRLGADELQAVQVLTTLLVMVHSKPGVGRLSAMGDRRLLWRFGISGDRPILVVTIAAVLGLRMVRALVEALQRWAWGGVGCDLVVINGEPRSYLMPLQLELRALSERFKGESLGQTFGHAGALYVVQSTELSDAERGTLTLLARARLNADGRPLATHVAELLAWHDSALSMRDHQDRTPLIGMVESRPTPTEPQGRWHHGDFDAVDGRYRFTVDAADPTPRPWVNVLANPECGAIVSEAGAGCTWAGNSRLHQLTAWGNDPLKDMDGEVFCIQDLRTREIWRVGVGQGGASVGYRVEHAPGFTAVRHSKGDLAIEAVWTVDPTLAVKRVRISVSNRGSRTLSIRVLGSLEWLMGAVRVDRQTVTTAFSSLPARESWAAVDVLLATQLDDHDGMGAHTAFLTLRTDTPDTAVLQDWTCDRRELFDARGHRVWPDHLGQRAGRGADPCAAASVTLRLAPGTESSCTFCVGSAASLAGACELAQQSAGPAGAGTHDLTASQSLTVNTPDPLFDTLVNHWLLYQTKACRLWGRAGFYQAGGAYGFRDQLQDVMALAVTEPSLVRAHLLRAAARQFIEGDVQHWWHPHSGAGVRTHFSDDLLWLPHVAMHYVSTTGDQGIYDEMVPFIEGDAVPEGDEDLYAVARVSEVSASLYEHCAKTLDRSLATGIHGLPLMGSGDWNDGMNRVGAAGRGESVWLAWFLCRVVADFAPLAHQRGDSARAVAWQMAEQGWRQALQTQAWDGQWYARAFFDDGTPLGSHTQSECRIDLIAQAWSVLSGAAPLDRQQQAMASAEQALLDNTHGLLRLLDPPLVAAIPAAGYIQAYPPGVRENGGQYNHGAVWAVMAWAKLGDGDAAWRAWAACSPAHRSTHPSQGPLYGLEPYAVAADVYSQPPYAGRGGWSWYTGSAAGLYRAAVSSVCGLDVQDDRVRLTPALPSHWPMVTLHLQRRGRVHHFSVCQADAEQAAIDLRAQGALTLAVGEWLDLSALGLQSHHLVVCPPRPLSLPLAVVVRP